MRRQRTSFDFGFLRKKTGACKKKYIGFFGRPLESFLVSLANFVLTMPCSSVFMMIPLHFSSTHSLISRRIR